MADTARAKPTQTEGGGRYVVMTRIYLCAKHARIKLEDEKYDHGFVLIPETTARDQPHVCNVVLCNTKAACAKPMSFSALEVK